MTVSYRFASFRLDPATRELWRGEAPVAVPPRAFDCIVYLIEHRDRAVGRDELIAAVWGRTDISDSLLGQTILAARRAFDDTGKDQHFIRTVVRFGYHWVAATDAEEIASPRSPLAVDTPARAFAGQSTRPEAMAIGAIVARRRWHPRLSLPVAAAAVVVAAAIALGIGFGTQQLRQRPEATRPDGAHAEVALVLPVEVTAEGDFGWVRLGVMDLVATRLRAAGQAVVPSDNVVALASTLTTPRGTPDLSALVAASGADLIVDVQAEREQTRWRVLVRTIHGHEPAIRARGESVDVLVAARSAADDLARQLGHRPASGQTGDVGPPALAALLQQIEAATLGDRLDIARALLASATAAERAQPVVRLREAMIDYQAGDLDAAQAGFGTVVRSVSTEQDRVLHARALSGLGVIAATRDDTVAATRYFDSAIDLLRGQDAPDALGKALNGRANLAGIAGRDDAARADFAEARVAFESSGNLLALAVLDSNLAALDMHHERYAEAESGFRRAADRFSTFAMKAAELNALTAMAEIDLALLEPAAALAIEPRVRNLVTQVSDPARQRSGELTAIQILVANGRDHRAAERLDAVQAAADQADDRGAQARAHALAAQIALDLGQPQRATDEAGLALQRFDAADDAREHARTFIVAIEAALASGQSAQPRIQALATLADRADSASARVYALLARAESASDEGVAGATYARALEAADALRIPLDLREVVRAYVIWLLDRRELARAGAVAERIAAYASRDYASALVQLRVAHAIGKTDLWHGALARVRALAGDRMLPAAMRVAPVSH